MKKKIFGGLATVLILAGIAGSHQQNAATPVDLTAASQNTASPSATAPDEAPVQSESTSPTPEPAPATPAPQTTQTPVASAPAPASNNCNPNYSPCIPNSASDLDCPDIGMQVTVIGTDVYRLDADHDGTGCDSY
jgi:micrococcal nuclease